MSRLDEHVGAVRNRIALQSFVFALAWAGVVVASLALLGVLIDRILGWHPPRPEIWLYALGAAGLLGAVAYALHRRPDARAAAIPIDQKLGLKEKISTALYIRDSKDPFARAAVVDAEQAARNVAVNLGEHFPLVFPKPAYASIGLAVLAFLSYKTIDPMDLFGHQAAVQQQVDQQAKADDARKVVEKALMTVATIPPAAADAEVLKQAKANLQAMLDHPISDPNKAKRTAVQALQDLNESIKNRVKESAKYAEAQNQAKMFRSMQKPVEGQGPVSDAHRAIAEGKFTEAIDDLSKAIENFDKMDKEQQDKVAQQMQNMAQQLQQMANNKAEQQKMEQQLQQLGMNQQQAQQAQQLMQQAANGDKQAQQQLQQMAQQVQQQMNQGQGPNPQQQQQMQQMQQMMNQMQAQANAQAQAQQMAQAAQQMAQAMQQAAKQQGQQQAQQQGQQPGQQQNQQMAQAMGQMQQQLQNMQAAAQDAQQIAAAQAAAQQAQQAAQQAMGGNGQPGGQQGNGNGAWAGNGDIAGQNNPNQRFNGRGAPAGANNGGVGAGDRTYKSPAPFAVKPEVDPSQDDEKGRILASNFIKDKNNPKGVSTESIREVTKAAVAEQTDEIDQERISRQAQKAVKEYFSALSDEQE
jgi:hypothetical protein